MKSVDADKLSPKETYNKPVLRSFPLCADEVMSVGCKVGTDTAVGQTIAGTCDNGSCAGVGS